MGELEVTINQQQNKITHLLSDNEQLSAGLAQYTQH